MTNIPEEDQEEQELFEHYNFEVDPGQSAIRIDKYLADRIQNVTRSKIQNGIDNGFVKVNGKDVKANYKVKPNDAIIISLPNPPRDEELLPQDIPIDIIYEDNDLLVVNKVAGMVVHPAHGNWDGTLVNALAFHFKNLPTTQNGEGRPGLIHRIDKDTSGLLVVAKTEHAMRHLAKQFFDHSIERTYWALVWGVPKELKGTINVHVGRSYKDRRVVDTFEDGSYGKHAITHYEVMQDLRYVSLVKCNLETGRTHQIRAHFKYLKHPLFNDAKYGGDNILKGTVFNKYRQFVQNAFKIMPRQALHAKSLGFIHPTKNEFMQFECPLPEDFQGALDKWEKYVNT